MKPLLLAVLIAAALGVAACGQATPTPSTFQSPVETSTFQSPVGPGIANPASQFCEEQGNKLEIRTAADGSQTGYCIFPDGTECEEWAFFRGECKPGMPKP